MRTLLPLLLACALGACLDRDLELPGYSAHILARGERVPKAEDDPVLAMRIAGNAGASGPKVALHSGFVDGAEVLYWDFGAATSSVEPVWIFQRGEGERAEPIEHPPLVDSLPGDDAYSPFRAVFTVAITELYDGEQLSSLAALEDAISLGLVEEPVATGTYVSWPIVPPDFELERRGEDELETEVLYGAGVRAHYLALSEPAPYERSVGAGTAYLLRRQNELSPLEEPARGADLNGDGDQLDSNVIFEDGVADRPSGLWSPVELTVASDYAFGAYRADADLFTRDAMDAVVPVPGAFIARSESEDYVYRPLYAMEEP